MKVYFPSWIRSMGGYCDGLVFCRYPELHHISYARPYVKPRISQHNHYYGDCFKAIINNLWKRASEDFKQDLKVYTKAWNQTQRPQDLDKHHNNSLNILIKACFNIARQNDFDLRTLNLENLSGAENALIGDLLPTVANLIKAAKMPECYLPMDQLIHLVS